MLHPAPSWMNYIDSSSSVRGQSHRIILRLGLLLPVHSVCDPLNMRRTLTLLFDRQADDVVNHENDHHDVEQKFEKSKADTKENEVTIEPVYCPITGF